MECNFVMDGSRLYCTTCDRNAGAVRLSGRQPCRMAATKAIGEYQLGGYQQTTEAIARQEQAGRDRKERGGRTRSEPAAPAEPASEESESE